MFSCKYFSIPKRGPSAAHHQHQEPGAQARCPDVQDQNQQDRLEGGVFQRLLRWWLPHRMGSYPISGMWRGLEGGTTSVRIIETSCFRNDQALLFEICRRALAFLGCSRRAFVNVQYCFTNDRRAINSSPQLRLRWAMASDRSLSLLKRQNLNDSPVQSFKNLTSPKSTAYRLNEIICIIEPFFLIFFQKIQFLPYLRIPSFFPPTRNKQSLCFGLMCFVYYFRCARWRHSQRYATMPSTSRMILTSGDEER